MAEASEIVFSIVTNSAAVKAVALGADGIVSGLRKGGIYIDMSTIEPDASRAVAAEFAKAGSIMLDGPLSGSPVTVKAGHASVMIGGDAAAFERAKPVLLAIGPKVTRIGGNGLACQMKIAVNLLLMVEVICFGEAVALAEKGGVVARGRGRCHPQERRRLAGAGLSRAVHSRRQDAGRAARRRDAAAEGHAAGAQSRRAQLGSPAPLAAAANEMMNACRGLGIDGNDFVVAHEVYRRLREDNRDEQRRNDRSRAWPRP